MTQRAVGTAKLIMGTEPRALINSGADRLREAGVATPEVDARQLLAHVCAVPPSGLLLLERVDDDQREAYQKLIMSRAGRIPLQHLTGHAFFRHVELAVGPGVFVPRPETEVMTGWVIEAARSMIDNGRSEVLIMEFGTGSGAIAKAIADELPTARIVAVELDPTAARWAATNLAGTGVELIEGDLSDPGPGWDGRVDLVVSNPPYIPLDAYATVAPEARDHDPALALFSGADGLDAIRALATTAARLLRAGGILATEHADSQGEAVVELLVGRGEFDTVRDHRDLTDRSRFTTAVRRATSGRSAEEALAGWVE